MTPEELLNKQGVPFTIKGKDLVTKCLSPDHDDKNPSFRVDRISGVAHCFSCGFKVNILKYYGLGATNPSIRLAKLKEKLKELHADFNGFEFPKQQVPYTKEYRGISNTLLTKFEAFYVQHSDTFGNRLWFPIKDMRGKSRGFVGRTIEGSSDAKYLVHPEGARLPIFPEVLEEQEGYVVLVEGIFDMLNLMDKGLTSVACTFGTQTLMKDTAQKMLSFKSQKIQKVFILFDNDEAGNNAAKKLIPILEELDFFVENLSEELPEDKDPGDLTEEEVLLLKGLCKSRLDTNAKV